MSLKQNNIISTLLATASESKQSTRVAAAICQGSKILAITVNNHRNKDTGKFTCIFDFMEGAVAVTLYRSSKKPLCTNDRHSTAVHSFS